MIVWVGFFVLLLFFFQAEDGIRDYKVTGVQTCALPILAPEYGATCGFFPVDSETLHYLKSTGRKPAQVALVEKYARAQGLFRHARSLEPQIGRASCRKECRCRRWP